MRNCTMLKKLVSLILILLIVSMPVLAQEEYSDFMQGKLDGEQGARGNPAWILGGLACGIIGVGAAYLIKPSPPADALIGKSAEYVLGYTEGYQKKSCTKNAGYACGGWAAFIIIYAAAGGFDTSE